MESRATREDHGLPVVVLAWTLLLVTTSIIGLRIYVRMTRLGKLLVDDYLMITAWVFEIIGSIFLTISWTYGIGRHVDTLSPASMAEAMKYTVVGVEPFSILAATWARMSFCMLLLFVLDRTRTWKRILLWSVFGIQIVINLLIVVQIEAQCGTHPAARWKYDPITAKKYGCEDTDVQAYLGYLQGSINSLCDLLLVVMPVVVLWSLQMPAGQKIGIGIILTLGLFACAASIAKTVFIQTVGSGDITWHISNLNLAQMIENNVVIIAGSIPTLRPLLRRDASKSQTSAPSSSRKGSWTFFHSKHGTTTNTVSSSARNERSKSQSSQASELQLMSRDHIAKTTTFRVAYEPWDGGKGRDADGSQQEHRAALDNEPAIHFNNKPFT